MGEQHKTYRVLDGTVLKIIAMISMVFDHVGDMFFPGVMWLRMIGRLAMPIFSFCIAEGFAHTRDRKKYLFRIGVFALISEIPFDLAFEGRIGFSHQNIMLTFFLSIVGLMLFDRIRGGRDTDGKQARIGKTCCLSSAPATSRCSCRRRIPSATCGLHGFCGDRRVPFLCVPAEASADPERCGRGVPGAHENGGVLLRDRLQFDSSRPV